MRRKPHGTNGRGVPSRETSQSRVAPFHSCLAQIFIYKRLLISSSRKALRWRNSRNSQRGPCANDTHSNFWKRGVHADGQNRIMRIEVMRKRSGAHSLDANDKLIQTRPHVRNTIASRKLQVVMRKGKSTINSCKQFWTRGTSKPWVTSVASIFAGKTTESVKVKCLKKHMTYIFYKFHICFFLSVLRKIKHTTHMCGGIKTLKNNLRTTLWLACHGHKNLAHASKTRQVKRSKWLQLLGSRFRVFVAFPDS